MLTPAARVRTCLERKKHIRIGHSAHGAALNQRLADAHADAVDMSPRVDIIESVHDQIEARKKRGTKCDVLDVALQAENASAWTHLSHARGSCNRLGTPHMLPLKQKLPIQVGDLYGVEIDDCDVSKSSEHNVLEQLAANAPSANDK